MSGTAGHISREHLCERLEAGEQLVLVDARSPMSYAISHLPGAVNLPAVWIDERAGRRIPGLDAQLVVYCESALCESSVRVAERLVELGYRNVLHYAGGMREWTEAGLPLEGGRRTA